MKAIFIALSFALALSTVASGFAATKTGTIPVSVKLVTGTKVGAYLVGNEIATTVDADGKSTPPSAYGLPILQISFETKRPWYFVKHVTWDRIHHHLTIDF